MEKKDVSGKKQLIAGIKAEGKLLKKSLDAYIRSLVDGDLYDIKKNSKLSSLSGLDVSRLTKFAKDCAEGNLDGVISTYSSMDETKKAVLPDRIKELLDDVNGEETIEDEDESTREETEETEDTPSPEETPEETPEEAKDAPSKVDADADPELNEQSIEKVVKESIDTNFPTIATVVVEANPDQDEILIQDVFNALESEYIGTVLDIEDFTVLRTLDNGNSVVKAVGIQWDGQDEEDELDGEDENFSNDFGVADTDDDDYMTDSVYTYLPKYMRILKENISESRR